MLTNDKFIANDSSKKPRKRYEGLYYLDIELSDILLDTSNQNSYDPMSVAMAAALLTKGFVILGGVSGVGKTYMARTFAECANTVGNQKLGESSTIPVSPSWTDESSVTGYWNPLTNSWETPEFLRLMKEANNNSAKNAPYFAILDEMNVARPEYYMLNLLSIMEIRGSHGEDDKDNTVTIKGKLGGIRRFGNQPVRLRNERVPLTHNMFLIGTANTDESTFNFSPKVLDRAFYFKFTANEIALDLSDEDYTKKMTDLAEKFRERMNALKATTCSPKLQIQNYTVGSWETKLWEDLKGELTGLNAAGDDPDSPVAFGPRCLNEMTAFIVNYIYLADSLVATHTSASDSEVYPIAFDWAVRTKLLPKFSGDESNLKKKLEVLTKITNDVLGNNTSPDWSSQKQIKSIENKLKKDGYYIY